MEYDENDAIEFIVKKIGIEIEEDEILNIIDIIWDYYEDNGMLDISMDNDEDESDITTLIAHVVKIVSKDKSSNLEKDVIAQIVEAELAYEESLDVF
jgi:hypothetical protein